MGICACMPIKSKIYPVLLLDCINVLLEIANVMARNGIWIGKKKGFFYLDKNPYAEKTEFFLHSSSFNLVLERNTFFCLYENIMYQHEAFIGGVSDLDFIKLLTYIHT